MEILPATLLLNLTSSNLGDQVDPSSHEPESQVTQEEVKIQPDSEPQVEAAVHDSIPLNSTSLVDEETPAEGSAPAAVEDLPLDEPSRPEAEDVVEATAEPSVQPAVEALPEAVDEITAEPTSGPSSEFPDTTSSSDSKPSSNSTAEPIPEVSTQQPLLEATAELVLDSSSASPAAALHSVLDPAGDSTTHLSADPVAVASSSSQSPAETSTELVAESLVEVSVDAPHQQQQESSESNEPCSPSDSEGSDESDEEESDNPAEPSIAVEVQTSNHLSDNPLTSVDSMHHQEAPESAPEPERVEPDVLVEAGEATEEAFVAPELVAESAVHESAVEISQTEAEGLPQHVQSDLVDVSIAGEDVVVMHGTFLILCR